MVLADIFGRKWGKSKILWNNNKSWAGMTGMFLGGWLLSILVVWIYSSMGIFPHPIIYYLLPISIIALVGTIVESLPLKDVDNITITLSAVLVGSLFF